MSWRSIRVPKKTTFHSIPHKCISGNTLSKGLSARSRQEGQVKSKKNSDPAQYGPSLPEFIRGDSPGNRIFRDLWHKKTLRVTPDGQKDQL